ncbi:penicillin acylase family protein [Alcanivorax sp. JB21]|uniref:penicillin acylase family protein n=1 Tax=Alcanivorax limicola TaxID=2874102 RepID=UPI001CBB2E6F|nr:penicillin acylase family protein [Alcanivorax limicola]MBZ2188712.1 penicillin acylase family protein [Alcanivorax limicola]
MIKRATTLFALAAAISLAACGGSSGGNLGNTPGGEDPRDPGNPGNPGNRTPVPVTQPFADYGTVMNILPPGQDDNGGVSNLLQDVPGLGDLLGGLLDDGLSQLGLLPALFREPHFDDQLDMYENLAFSPAGLTDDELVNYFKDAPMLAPDAGNWTRELTVAEGDYRVDIKRDDFGVPHIYGEHRTDALFGMGYVTAEDRLFLLDVLRRAGRGQLSKFLGPADFSFDNDIARNAPYREIDLSSQIAGVASKLGDDGAQILVDAEAFVAGLNKYVDLARQGLLEVPIEYVGLGVNLEPFVREDVVAIATLIQGIFAGGGGAEHRNVLLLQELLAQTNDPRVACDLWRDLRHANDPEASVTTVRRFATQSPAAIDENACPLEPAFAGRFPAAVMFDEGSFQAQNPLLTEPCGRPGQVMCPGADGAIPALPGTGVINVIIDGTLNLLRGLLSLAVVDSAPRDGMLASVGSWYDATLERFGLRDAPEAPAALAARDGLSTEQLRELTRERVIGTLASLDGLRDGFPNTMSNALLINGEHTASGHPLAVFGPQTSYFVPQLLLEMSVHGGDLNTRGMTFTGLPYVVIGRGPDFAWSATSGNSDLTDVRVLRLCTPNGSSDPQGGYLFKGQCKPFDVINDTWAAKWNLAVPMDDPTSVGQNIKVTRNVIRSDDYGPVLGFATVNGQPVALARQRTTYFAELDTALPFVRATRNDVFDAQSFREVFSATTGSFNWFYADKDDISFIHTGLYPRRASGVHPELPSWGDGSADWTGFLTLEDMPNDTNPARGYLASWNNRPAKDWWSADDNASYQLVHRNDMLDVRLEQLVSEGNITLARLTEAMGDAAVVDLRGQEILPAAINLLRQGSVSGDIDTALNLLAEWNANGAFRRDRNNDGRYDEENAVALMDAWYTRMIERLLPQVTALENTPGGNLAPVGRDNAPGDMGSAYQSGYYGYLRRTLDMAAGTSEVSYRALRCADSESSADCRSALMLSLIDAMDDLGGVSNMDNWTVNMDNDAIGHRAIGLASLRLTHWQNRPTFQQIVEFRERR